MRKGCEDFNPAYIQGEFGSYFPNADTKILVYGTDWCKYCDMTRQYLRDRKVNFLYKDIEKNEAGGRQFDKLRAGGRTFPLVIIGNRMIMGYAPEEFEDAIQAVLDLAHP
jgi:glutaredoxin